jgi:hypothetical protein
MLLQVVGWKLHSTNFVKEYRLLILIIVMETFSNTIIQYTSKGKSLVYANFSSLILEQLGS